MTKRSSSLLMVTRRGAVYAAAWGLLCTAHWFWLLGDPAVITGSVEKARPIVDQHLAKGRAAAERAIRLDPKSADGYLGLSEVAFSARDFVGGMRALNQALALDQAFPDALQSYSVRL